MPVRLVSRSTLTIASLLALTVPALAFAATTVKFELDDGAKVSDTQTVVVKASTTDDDGVSKVEFYVDDQLKGADTSTPYEFTWDTLSGTEGAHTLKAIAFDAKGNSESAKISVTVDNELSKGADAHAAAALEAVKAGNTDLAARLSRRALKIDPGHLGAARAYAGVLRQRGDLAQAVSVLDKATIPDNDTDTRMDLVGLHMALAEASDSTEDLLREAAVARDIYKKVSAIRLANGTDPIARGDVLVASRDLNAAVLAYQKCGAPDVAPVECVNRQLLALITARRTKEAEAVIRSLTRNKRADVNTQVLVGLLALNNHDFKKALASVQPGIEANNVAAIIIAAYAEAASKRMQQARDLADKAYALAPDSADVRLLRAFVLADDQEARKEFGKALELNPTLAEAYVQRAFVVMMQRDANRFQAADQMLETAAKIDPKNAYVMMGKALSFISQRRSQEAEPILESLLTEDPNGADAHVATALNMSLLDKQLKITEHLNTALKLDPDRFADVFVPKPTDLVARTYRYRVPVVVLPSSLSK